MFSGNSHPILVHFPVALLCLYPLLMIAEYRLKKYQNVFLGVRVIVLGISVLFLAASNTSGEAIRGVGEINLDVAKTLQRHEMYAGLTNSLTWIAFLYAALSWIALHPTVITKRVKLSGAKQEWFDRGVAFVKKYHRATWHLTLALLVGFSVALTGSEGGKLAYLYRVNAITCEPVAHPLGRLSKILIPFVNPEHADLIGNTPAFDVRCGEK